MRDGFAAKAAPTAILSIFLSTRKDNFRISTNV